MAHYLNRGCGVWKFLPGGLEFLIKIIGSLIALWENLCSEGKRKNSIFGENPTSQALTHLYKVSIRMEGVIRTLLPGEACSTLAGPG